MQQLVCSDLPDCHCTDPCSDQGEALRGKAGGGGVAVPVACQLPALAGTLDHFHQQRCSWQSLRSAAGVPSIPGAPKAGWHALQPIPTRTDACTFLLPRHPNRTVCPGSTRSCVGLGACRPQRDRMNAQVNTSYFHLPLCVWLSGCSQAMQSRKCSCHVSHAQWALSVYVLFRQWQGPSTVQTVVLCPLALH